MRTPSERLRIYYAGRRHVPVALRALIDWFGPRRSLAEPVDEQRR